MITYKDKNFNSWKDVVKQYPAMWVVFADIDLKHGQVQSGTIMAIIPDDEVIEYRHKNHGKIKLSLRTTETVKITDDNGNIIGYGGATSSGGGYIHGELVDA